VTNLQSGDILPDMKGRYITDIIEHDALLDGKIAFIGGPRQVGKSTLAKQLLTHPENYFLYDRDEFKKAWSRSPEVALSGRSPGPVVLDEIQKDRLWKRKVKGLYDTFGEALPLLITGSARLDHFRKGSDSLLGRYIPYRLHPFSVAELPQAPLVELESQGKKNYSWNDLLNLGGFPEPLLKGDLQYAKRWSRLRSERLVAEDSRDIKTVLDVNALSLLAKLLPDRVGSQLSINSLREDLSKNHATVSNWIELLEALYFCFRIPCYSNKISRSIKLEKKLYLYDMLQLSKAPIGVRHENLTALHLLKACDFWTDTGTGHFELHYLRTRDNKEVDFLVTQDGDPWLMVECKSGETSPSLSLIYFSSLLKPTFTVQLVEKKGFDKEFPALGGIRVMSYESFFARMV
jgi:uncharacterized protein